MTVASLSTARRFVRLAGVDFTSSPRPAKPVTVALGHAEADAVVLQRIDRHADFASFATWLRTPGPWLAAFDFPFGLPRLLAESLGWPLEWLPLVRHYAALPRAEIRARFGAWCAARPAGSKFAHRACDAHSGASPSMKWVNPPVAFMLHAGVPLLVEAGVDLPRLHAGDPQRVALEGYPGLLAREFVGRRSYKSDDRRRHSSGRRDARETIVSALEAGAGRLGIRLVVTASQRRQLVDDGSADALDAVLCLGQAAWAAARPGWGLPADVDPLEGWIVSALPPGSPVGASRTLPDASGAAPPPRSRAAPSRAHAG